jgi:hypothetical protein
MRKLRALAFTAVLGFALAACSQGGSGAISAIDVDPKSVEAHVTKLAGETFKGTATTAADIESLRAALPAEVAVSWGGLSFDAATVNPAVGACSQSAPCSSGAPCSRMGHHAAVKDTMQKFQEGEGAEGEDEGREGEAQG